MIFVTLIMEDVDIFSMFIQWNLDYNNNTCQRVVVIYEILGLFTLVPGIWPPAAALARLCHSIVMIDNRVTDDP
ncbi:hypothetical protein M514_05235 [Trichuris suis]|uniref:Uncharacterized protein n=1 Tax=Trichuris suis TaxID=68888 RepID=A0A085M9S2_9BILA|nr:hypothetical protein M513_05235 [Trichuris suis]KFD67355.1 hypothetical protein M514_05235 [Trichuris suis]